MSGTERRGPFERPEDAIRAAAHLNAALEAADPHRSATEQVRRARAAIRIRHVLGALNAAHVPLGPYDQTVAAWLARWDPATIVVVLDWVASAFEAGNVDLLADCAQHIQACRTPDFAAGDADKCVHGAWSQCEITELAWRLRGIDPETARTHRGE
jgi:hypothetical protein